MVSASSGPWREPDLQIRQWLNAIPFATYTCDPTGLLTGFNRHAALLWGRRPRIRNILDRYCGSYKLFAVSGAAIPHHRCWMALALQEGRGFNRKEIVVQRPDGSRRTALAHANPIHDSSGTLTGGVNVLVDVSARKEAQQEDRRFDNQVEEKVRERTASLEKANHDLRYELEQVKTLRGFILICSWCKSVCDETSNWCRLEAYLHTHSEADFTHGVCPDCAQKLYAEIGRMSPGS